MCGINGIFYLAKDRNTSEEQLVGMMNSMIHRGPDGFGIFIDKNIGLGHRRLSIIDLSIAGKQPFTTQDGRFTIVFNGEIYNYKELKSDLVSAGVRFRSESDTEVLLYLYALKGKACLDLLNGMFSFAIWDSKEEILFCARDRVGVKPFYYALYDNTFYFASEPKALFAAGVPAEINQDGLPEWLLFRSISGEKTFFKHVRRLLPGHCMSVNVNNIKYYRWWNLPEIIQNNRETLPKNPFDWFEETFYSSIQYRTISDVPVGLMLSGGLDSGCAAVALNRTGNKEIAAFTITFREKEHDEGEMARLTALENGLNFHAVSLEGDELLHTLEDATGYHDEPLIHLNDAHILALSRFAKPLVSVLLSGEGSDEFMGGYVRYKPLRFQAFKHLIKSGLPLLKLFGNNRVNYRYDKLTRYFGNHNADELVMFNASNLYPIDFHGIGYEIHKEQFDYRNAILKEAKNIYPGNLARQAMYMDLFCHLSTLLDRNDRMTMGASIECRDPFMDYRLMEIIPALPDKFLLPGKKGKKLLLESVGKKLPQAVRDFRKIGLSVPWTSYLKEGKGQLREMYLQMENGFSANFFPQLQIKKRMAEFEQGNQAAQALVSQLLMLEIWAKVNSRNI